MNDLIYDEAAWEEVQTRFPEAVIRDASDMIHDSRISIELPDNRRDEYLGWVILAGWGRLSLGIQIMLYDSEGREKIKKWCEEARVKT